MEANNKTITLDEELFNDLVIQAGILKEIYDKIGASREMNVFQKKVLLQNKKKNVEVLQAVERFCESTEE